MNSTEISRELETINEYDVGLKTSITLHHTGDADLDVCAALSVVMRTIGQQASEKGRQAAVKWFVSEYGQERSECEMFNEQMAPKLAAHREAMKSLPQL